MHVFAYGTLMFPEVWRAIVARNFATIAGSMAGYAIFRVEHAHFPGIAAAGTGSIVRGLVYLDVDAESLARLDRFEDDFYVRQAIAVDCDDGQQRLAEAYVVPPQNAAVLSAEKWEPEAFVAAGHLESFIRRFAGFARV